MRKSKSVVVTQNNTGNAIKTVLCIVGIGVVLVTMIQINRDKAKTVDIVAVKDTVYVNQLITEDNITSYPMAKLEYDSSKNQYLLWENKDQVIDKFATVATKKDSYLYKGDVADTKPIKNEWLQRIEKGKVVVSLPYDKSSAFGNILTPGDTVIVSVSYKEPDPNGLGGDKQIQEILYKEAKVIDLLNNSGNSIYDYYSDLLALPLAEREELLRDEGFLNNVSPSRILCTVGVDEGFIDYAKVTGASGISYTYGLYPREEGDIIIDQFSDLTRQISSALTNNAAAEITGGVNNVTAK